LGRSDSSYLEALILEELEDDLFEQCGVDTRHDPQDAWLDRVKQRLREDLHGLRADIEGPHDQIEEWDFHGSRIFAAVGCVHNDGDPLSGYGWLCRLVDASVLQAAGFYRVRKPLLPLRRVGRLQNAPAQSYEGKFAVPAIGLRSKR
jgi:hypothetical protein